MAWTAKDDFDSYTNGATLPTLNGGSNWGGAWVNDSMGGNISVTNATSYQGANSIICSSGNDGDCKRLLSGAITSGTFVMYLAIRRDQVSGGQAVFYFQNSASGNITLLKIYINSSGNLTIQGTTTQTMTAASANTWYVVQVTVNATLRTATAAYSTAAYGTAGTFSADTLPVAFFAANDVNQISVVGESGGGASYFDYISDTTPFPAPSGPTNLKTLDTNVKANIKTYNTNVLANIKSINTNT